MAASPITSWQMEGGKVKAVIYFIFLGSKITADGDWSHKIKRCLLLGKKAMTNLDRVLKSRDITLLTKICIVKAMVFPVVHVRYESWAIKEAEHQRIDAFKLVVLEKTLEGHLDCKIIPVSPRGNQPWIFIGRTDAEAEAPILRLLDVKNQLIPDLDAGKDWRQTEKEVAEMRWLDSITDSMDMNLSKLWKRVEDRGARSAAVREVTKNWTWLSDWTITTFIKYSTCKYFLPICDVLSF